MVVKKVLEGGLRNAGTRIAYDSAERFINLEVGQSWKPYEATPFPTAEERHHLSARTPRDVSPHGFVALRPGLSKLRDYPCGGFWVQLEVHLLPRTLVQHVQSSIWESSDA